MSTPSEETQTWDPDQYARNARFVADLGQPVVDLLGPRAGERILDLGCGDGYLTAKLAALGCHVVGVDSSAAQVEAAQRLGLDARVGDGQELEFHEEFDAVFSNATLHWLRRPDSVIDGVWSALKPGGRFVGEFGGHGCVARIRQALGRALSSRGHDISKINPWYFPTAGEYGERLEARGFAVDQAMVFPRPTPLPGAMKDWLETFAKVFTAVLPPEERDSFLLEVQEDCRPALCDTQGRWTADYTRCRFRAFKPA
jgi:trans-aconitate methyltransferase